MNMNVSSLSLNAFPSGVMPALLRTIQPRSNFIMVQYGFVAHCITFHNEHGCVQPLPKYVSIMSHASSAENQPWTKFIMEQHDLLHTVFRSVPQPPCHGGVIPSMWKNDGKVHMFMMLERRSLCSGNHGMIPHGTRFLMKINGTCVTYPCYRRATEM